MSRLILVGAFIKGRRGPGLDCAGPRRESEMQRELIRLGWGRDDPSFRLYFSSIFMPDADPQLWTDFAELMRRTTSAENALRLFDAVLDMDVTRGGGEPWTCRPSSCTGATRRGSPSNRASSYAARIRAAASSPSTPGTTCCDLTSRPGSVSCAEVDAFLADDESTQSPRPVHVVSKDAAARNARRLSHRHR